MNINSRTSKVNFTGFASGAIASFTGLREAPIKVRSYVNAIQSGSGDPSPDNIRPIIGASECNVVRCGTNVWDEEWEQGTFDNSTGEKKPYSNYWRSKNRIAVLPNTTYYAATSGDNVYRYYYDKSGNYIGNANGVSNRTFTTPDGAYYLNFVDVTRPSYDSSSNPISINYPSTDTTYHAYTGNTYIIQLGDTYYGGYLDVTTGVLTVTHVFTTIDKNINPLAVNWLPTSYGVGWFYQFNDWDLPPITASETFDGLCDMLKPVNYNQIYAHSEKGAIIAITNINTTKRVYVWQNDTTLIDNASIKAWLADNPIHLTYPLATPITVQLTPTQVEQIIGSNSISSDAGNVEVYFVTI